MADSHSTQPCIYAIRNVVNGRRYIGSSIRHEQRWRDHRRLLTRGVHRSAHLQRAWDKYGAASFVFEVIEVVLDPLALITREQVHIDQCAKPYNIELTAGKPRTMAGRTQQRKRPPMTAAQRAAVSAASLGRRHTPETRAKLRARVISEETREKIRAGKTGRPQSEQAKEKQRRAQLLRFERYGVSEETREKLRQLGLARGPRGPVSDETRARMRHSSGLRHARERLHPPPRRPAPPVTDEARENMRRAQLLRRALERLEPPPPRRRAPVTDAARENMRRAQRLRFAG